MNQAEQKSFADKLAQFLRNIRIPLIVFFSILVVGIICFFVFNEITESRNLKAAQTVKKAETVFSEWSVEADEEKKAELENTVITDLDTVIKKYPGTYGAQRSLFLLGQLNYEKEEWETATDKYLELVESFPESYLVPIALINAGAAQEHLKELEKARDYYNQAAENTYHSTEAAKAFYSAGRVSEALNDKAAAIETYQKLVESYPSSNWTNLARNRIIYLNLD